MIFVPRPLSSKIFCMWETQGLHASPAREAEPLRKPGHRTPWNHRETKGRGDQS
jgi:hypothetical protein